jgi:putative endonuclease
VYYEVFATKQEAMKREYAVKQLTRQDKLKLLSQLSEDGKAECNRIMKKCSTVQKMG